MHGWQSTAVDGAPLAKDWLVSANIHIPASVLTNTSTTQLEPEPGLIVTWDGCFGRHYGCESDYSGIRVGDKRLIREQVVWRNR